MKGEIIYHLNCGCIAKRKDLVRMKDGLACKKHKARVADRKQKCKACKILFSIGRHKHKSLLCPECKRLEKIRNQREKRVIDREAKKAEAAKKPVKKKRIQKSREYYALRRWEIDRRGSYCSNLPVCIMQKKVECQGCQEFIPIIFGHDPAKLPGFYRKSPGG